MCTNVEHKNIFRQFYSLYFTHPPHVLWNSPVFNARIFVLLSFEWDLFFYFFTAHIFQLLASVFQDTISFSFPLMSEVSLRKTTSHACRAVLEADLSAARQECKMSSNVSRLFVAYFVDPLILETLLCGSAGRRPETRLLDIVSIGRNTKPLEYSNEVPGIGSPYKKTDKWNEKFRVPIGFHLFERLRNTNRGNKTNMLKSVKTFPHGVRMLLT